MRPGPLLAIAHRDLAMQLRGRRGFVLPLIAGLLLLPLSTVSLPSGSGGGDPLAVPISGEVPPALRDTPGLTQVDHGGYRLRSREAGLEIEAEQLPIPLRHALDRAYPSPLPAVEVVQQPPPPLPGRSLLLALVAASLLTGAVSESLPGERGRGTLEALLTAAVSRGEIIVGKWIAWGGAGALLASTAAIIAIASGIMEVGPWLIPLPLVPPATVALGFFLVHRTSDLVGGATVSLRVLPAALSILGLIAWAIGLFSPALGAAVPLGGALVAAGSTWEGLGPPVIASLSTGLTIALCLAVAAHGLERTEGRGEGARVVREALGLGLVAIVWWSCLLMPTIWGPAGNPGIGESLSLTATLTAAALALGIIALTRSAQPGGWAAIQLRWPRITGWLSALTIAGAATLALVLPIPPWLPAPPGILSRLDVGLGLWTAGLPAAILAIIVQEALFRGLLTRAVGPWVAGVAFVVIVSPHQPVQGALLTAALAYVARTTGSVLPGMLGRAAVVAAVSGASLAWGA